MICGEEEERPDAETSAIVPGTFFAGWGTYTLLFLLQLIARAPKKRTAHGGDRERRGLGARLGAHCL